MALRSAGFARLNRPASPCNDRHVDAAILYDRPSAASMMACVSSMFAPSRHVQAPSRNTNTDSVDFPRPATDRVRVTRYSSPRARSRTSTSAFSWPRRTTSSRSPSNWPHRAQVTAPITVDFPAPLRPVRITDSLSDRSSVASP